MSIKIVTDSSADLPAKIIEELGITVVPFYVRFGGKVYRDRVDISEEEFYRKLQQESTPPSTTQPSPQDFATVYKRLLKETDSIISIHISSRFSGTVYSANKGKELAEAGSSVEIVDSKTLTMGLGLITMEAARLANQGVALEEIANKLKEAVTSVRLLGLLDTLKYLVRGGRIGKAKVLLGSVLNVKPLLRIENGEVVPVGQIRSRSQGIDRLFNFVKNTPQIHELSSP
jgi:DegV family protein with EDD domain